MQATIRPTRTISPVYPGIVPDMLYIDRTAVLSPVSVKRIETYVVGRPCANVSGKCGCSCCGGSHAGVPTITTRWYCDCWKGRDISWWGRTPHGCGCVVREESRAMTAREWRDAAARVARWGAGEFDGYIFGTTPCHTIIDEDGNVTREINKEPANG